MPTGVKVVLYLAGPLVFWAPSLLRPNSRARVAVQRWLYVRRSRKNCPERVR